MAQAHLFPFPIKSMILILGYGQDTLSIIFDGPTPYPGMGYELSASIPLGKGVGEEWVKANLPGYPVEIIRTR